MNNKSYRIPLLNNKKDFRSLNQRLSLFEIQPEIKQLMIEREKLKKKIFINHKKKKYKINKYNSKIIYKLIILSSKTRQKAINKCDEDLYLKSNKYLLDAIEYIDKI